MELFDAIYHRRSIRKYTSSAVSEAMVQEIIKAAMYAPSAVNKQPWHFIVINDEEVYRQIIEVHPNASMLTGCATAILICYDEKLQHDAGFGAVDCSAATQNALLAAHGLGLGAVWIGIYPRQNRINSLQTIYNLPANIVPFSIISLGKPAEKKSHPQRFDPARIHYNRW